MTDPSVFEVLPEGRCNWAVASIFGQVDRLAALHALLDPRIAARDNLVYLGNLLGRGDVAATIDELLLFRRSLMARRLDDGNGAIVYLRGSQEEMWHKLLQMQFAPNPAEVFEWMLGQGVGATLEAYAGSIDDGRTAARLGAVALSRWTNQLRAAVRAADGHDQLLSALRRAAYTRDNALLFVNAGVDPRRPLSAQRDSFWWGSREFETTSEPYGGFRRVVRGADPKRAGVVVRHGMASIDGGCGFGGPLIAGCFDAAGELVDLIEA
jgi:serine/threonine protein phosphatase 1